MSEAITVKVSEQPIGIVIGRSNGRGYRFYAALRSVEALDGQRFPSPEAAEAAAREHLEGRFSKAA